MMTTRNTLLYKVHSASDGIRSLKEQVARDYSDGKSVFPSISPKHPGWADYLAAKRQVSLLFTAIKLAKSFGTIPSRRDFRKALRDPAFKKMIKVHIPAEIAQRKDKLHAFAFEALKIFEDAHFETLAKSPVAVKAAEYAEQRAKAAAERKVAEALVAGE